MATRRLLEKNRFTVTTVLCQDEAEKLQALMDGKNWNIAIALRAGLHALFEREGLVPSGSPSLNDAVDGNLGVGVK